MSTEKIIILLIGLPIVYLNDKFEKNCLESRKGGFCESYTLYYYYLYLIIKVVNVL